MLVEYLLSIVKEIGRNCKYDWCQKALASVVFKCLGKKTRSGISVNELHKLDKPGIKKFKRRKVYARFKDNIWVEDLAEIGPSSSKNENIKCLLCFIDVFTKYIWIKPLKDKIGKIVLNAFIEIVNESNCKPNKLWLDQGRELYNQLMQECLGNNDISMSSSHNESNSIIAERLIKTLKAKIYKNDS